MNWTIWMAVGAIFAGLGVGAGAFGAHALRARVSVENLAIFETGARYQMYHALALLAVGLAAVKIDAPSLAIAGWAFCAGIVIFSGSLYTLALTDMRWLGMVTPVGGVAFLVGWVALAAAMLRPVG